MKKKFNFNNVRSIVKGSVLYETDINIISRLPISFIQCMYVCVCACYTFNRHTHGELIDVEIIKPKYFIPIYDFNTN